MSRKKEKGEHTQKIVSTSIPGIKAKVNCQKYTDGSYRLAGQLINAKTLLRLDADVQTTMKVDTETQLDAKERYLVGRLCDMYSKKTKAAKRRMAKEPREANRLYSEAFETLSKDQYARLFPSSFQAVSTRKNALAYFRTTYLPMLDCYGRDIGATERVALVDALRQHAQSHGNYGGNIETATRQARFHASYLNHMYRVLCTLVPEYDLPEIELPLPGAVQTVQTEQVKALSDEVCVKFAALLQRLPESGLAVGAALMLTGMARTAEACAPLWGDIVLRDTYAVYGVLWQGQDCKRCDVLKSSASYRIMILPKFTVDLLKARVRWLLSQGYTSEQIATMPVCSTCNDPCKQADPNSLSEFVRQLLSLLGCTKSFWATVDAAIFNEPDMDHDHRTPLRDPSAYVLRRNACSLCCNVCGMDPDLVDALMGHKLRKSCKTQWDRYIRRPDNWEEIAGYLERVVWDPRHSNHPAFAPIQLIADQPYISSYKQVRFVLQVPTGADTQYMVCYEVETSEPGDTIFLNAPRAINVQETASNLFHQEYSPIIGDVGTMHYYLEMIRQAEKLDLSRFLPTAVIKAEPTDAAMSPKIVTEGGNNLENENNSCG